MKSFLIVKQLNTFEYYLLKQNTTKQASLKHKRKFAALDNKCRAEILLGRIYNALTLGITYMQCTIKTHCFYKNVTIQKYSDISSNSHQYKVIFKFVNINITPESRYNYITVYFRIIEKLIKVRIVNQCTILM